MPLEDEPTTPVAADLLLTIKDFPANFVNCSHPSDYQLMDTPLPPEYIYHCTATMTHPRLICRVSFRINAITYLPVSFVVDTGAPKMYFGPTLWALALQHGILQLEPELGVHYIVLFGKKHRVEPTPTGHCPANIMGLRALCQLNLQLTDEPSIGFHFSRANFTCLHC